MKIDYKQVIHIYSNLGSEISDVSHQLHAITGCDDMLDTLNLDRSSVFCSGLGQILNFKKINLGQL